MTRTVPSILPDRLAAIAGLPIHKGSGRTLDTACVMQLVSYVAGEPWTDRPACACPVVTSFLISWNDGLPSDADRTRLLSPLIPRVVGSRSTRAVERARSFLALDWLIRVHTPAWLDLVESCKPRAAALRALAPIVDIATAQAATETVRAARGAAYACWTAAGAAAGAAAEAAAEAAAKAAAGAAAKAAAWAAAKAAAGTAAKAAAGTVAWAAAEAAAWAAGAAGAAAADAAGAALQPTVLTLQASAVDLVERMLAVEA